MSGDEVVGALAMLRSSVDRLLDADLSGVDAPGFARVLESLEVQRRRLDAVDTQLVAAVDQAHVAARHCRSSTADLLVHQLRLSPGAARARVRRARDLGPRYALSGERLEPIHPILAAAQRAGSISTQHVDVATKALGKIPADIAVEATPVAEQFLVTAARHENPKGLARSATMLLERLNPDGDEPGDERVHEAREFGLHRRSDGSWTPYGAWTEETGLLWETILAALSAPVPADESGQPDTRTPGQRRHDAMLELGLRVLRGGTLGDAGGAPVTVLIGTTPADLVNPGGINRSEHGHLVRTRALMFLLGDAELVPLLFDRAENARADRAATLELKLGRSRRLASKAQRRALAARDGGCCFPNCDRPASWCEAHHIIPWNEGGPTDLDNLCLLCAFHHREFQRRAWAVAMSDGLPHWTPPPWIDPTQTPRVNRAHHLPEIIFCDDGTITARPSAPLRH